nr:MAG TPA: hypothetical protein [Caudoviricetes sp.]DAR76159.1 MAG TPA: hypothetical protein [Bacteriophage sp.]
MLKTRIFYSIRFRATTPKLRQKLKISFKINIERN